MVLGFEPLALKPCVLLFPSADHAAAAELRAPGDREAQALEGREVPANG
jgi:hypothetical protein